jgi:hypothetical protein
MPQGGFADQIRFHRDQADFFLIRARQGHIRADRLARRALRAQWNGRPVRARLLMQEALRVKAAAGRADLRSKNHRVRVVALRHARAALRVQGARQGVSRPAVRAVKPV